LEGRKTAFSLLEILVALAILTIGLLAMLRLLQKTLQASEPIEFETRAALLADSILEGIRSHPDGGFPFVPGLNPATWPYIDASPYPLKDTLLLDGTGSPFNMRTNTKGLRLPFVFSIPGNGVDDDAGTGRDPLPWMDIKAYRGSPPVEDLGGGTPATDGMDDSLAEAIVNSAPNPDPTPTNHYSPRAVSHRDFDGMIEADVSAALLRGAPLDTNPVDGDHDGIPDDTGDSSLFGIDDFYNGIFQYDHSAYAPDGDFTYDPQRGIDEEISDGKDNDGDGLVDEDVALSSQLRKTALVSPGDPPNRNNPYDYVPLLAGNGLDDDGDGEEGSPIDIGAGKKMADGVNNNDLNGIDEGIDEEIFDGKDNDNDGLVDEDCQGAYFPWQPMPLPPPNEEYSFRIMVTRVQLGGDGIDNDGDAFDADSRLPNVFPWLTNNLLIDEEFYDGVDNDLDGLTDEDLMAYPAPRARRVTVFIYQGDDRKDNDGDGWIDEESEDGIDDDFDNNPNGPDEDTYRRVYKTSAIVELPE
jgi:type II secretory pathway pseudopilin PulG